MAEQIDCREKFEKFNLVRVANIILDYEKVAQEFENLIEVSLLIGLDYNELAFLEREQALHKTVASVYVKLLNAASENTVGNKLFNAVIKNLHEQLKPPDAAQESEEERNGK